MLAMRSTTEDSTEETPKVSLYEQCREARIKENLQRMQNLGILNLSLKLKSESRPVKRPYSAHSSKSTPLLHPSRRSSRLENSAPIMYTRVKCKTPKREKSKRRTVVISGGPRAEVYTEEHEKLLGSTERSWNRFVDGCDKAGRRIYDPFKGKTCHQCRQKTLGYRTRCSECDMIQGQFCGDCLFTRYGEHVLEALENPNWICPVCRGICNCSLCRNQKGWLPTGQIYREIAKLGYKSVAHYLIQTKRLRTDEATSNQATAKRPLSVQEAKPLCKIADDDLPEETVPKLQNMENENGDSLKREEDENINENLNSTGRSLSLFFPPVDNQTSVVDVQVKGYLEPSSKEDKQVQERTEHNQNLEARPISYFVSDENQTLVIDAQDVVLCNETETRSNSVNAQERRSTRNAAMKHCPDSIGGRVRQRRRSQSGIDESTNDNLNSATRSLSVILPSADETLVADAHDLVLCEVSKTREIRSKRKAVLKPNRDSIGGRLRQRRSVRIIR